jgi:threonine/homoserine/homoserine lactone efflux protein
MNTSLFITYLVTVAVLMLTPGPDMLFCLAAGLKGGPRSGFMAAVGAASGEIVHITAAAVGLAALFRAAPLLFDMLRILGAAYLVLLGFRAFRDRDSVTDGGNGDAAATTRRAYRRGLLTNLLNPKMALFTIAFLPQFIDRHAGSVPLQFAVLGTCFVALEIAVDGTVGILAGRLTLLFRRARTRRAINLTAGSVYLGLGVRIAVER